MMNIFIPVLSKSIIGGGAIEQALVRMKQKYPIGSPLSVAYHHDEHFYPCIVKKYHTPTKLQVERGEEWIFAQFADKTKQWVDLHCIHYMKIPPEETWTLDDTGDDDPNNDGSSLLGKRIDVVWNDGNEYCGIVTKIMKNNQHFVFLEYSDGDKCWCDLREEYEWSIRGEEKEKEGEENSSSTSEAKNSNKKRKASSSSATTTTTTTTAAGDGASTKKKEEQDTKKMKGPGAAAAAAEE